MHFVEAQGILSARNGINVYRGCTHGCIYCDSRSACYGMTHPFEDVEVKQNAPELLAAALRGRRRKCMIGTGSMSDPYMHCEEQLGITRRCLEVIRDQGFGAAVQTKSDRVLRDLDLLCEIQARSKAVVQMTLTTADEALCRLIEPNVCTTSARVEALCRLKAAGIPTAVWISPLLPFINDTEENLRALLEGCFEAGVRGILCFGIGVTLREGDREYFYQALDRHFPGMKRRYAEAFGLSYECASPNHARLMGIFHEECEKHHVLHRVDEVFSWLRDYPDPLRGQLSFL